MPTTAAGAGRGRVGPPPRGAGTRPCRTSSICRSSCKTPGLGSLHPARRPPRRTPSTTPTIRSAGWSRRITLRGGPPRRPRARLSPLARGASSVRFAYNGLAARQKTTVDGNVTLYALDQVSGLSQVLSDGATAYLYGFGGVGGEGHPGW